MQTIETWSGVQPQIREQMSGPDLHVLTLKVLALEKMFFPHKRYFQFFFCFIFVDLYSMQFFSASPRIFSKKIGLTFCP